MSEQQEPRDHLQEPDSDQTAHHGPDQPRHIDPAELLEVLWLDRGMPLSMYVHKDIAIDSIGALLDENRYFSAVLTKNVAIWMSASAEAEHNAGASRVVKWLLDDIISGVYPATEAEQEYAAKLVREGDLAVPGRSLITGMIDQGDVHAPTTLPEQFTNWLTSRIARHVVESKRALHKRLGLPNTGDIS